MPGITAAGHIPNKWCSPLHCGHRKLPGRSSNGFLRHSAASRTQTEHQTQARDCVGCYSNLWNVADASMLGLLRHCSTTCGPKSGAGVETLRRQLKGTQRNGQWHALGGVDPATIGADVGGEFLLRRCQLPAKSLGRLRSALEQQNESHRSVYRAKRTCKTFLCSAVTDSCCNSKYATREDGEVVSIEKS